MRMEAAFDDAALRKWVSKLSREARVAFMLSIAERLAPNHAAFVRHHGWGDSTALHAALELGWRWLAGERVDAAAVRALIERCEAVTPDTEDFESEFVSAALDAAIVCRLVLEMVLEHDGAKLVEAASLARDSVDLHVQELESLDPGDPQLERKILEHPLMQQELRRQREDLELLERTGGSARAVAELAPRWRRPATSNLGR